MNASSATFFNFTEADKSVIIELCKVGYVKVQPSQIILISELGSSLRFKDFNKCDGLQLPPNWAIEWISSDERYLAVTIGIKGASSNEAKE